MCRSVDSHTVSAVRNHAVCRKPKSHTEARISGRAVCKSLDPHTVTAVRNHAVCRSVDSHTTLLHPPEVILSGWKMPLSPNFRSDALSSSGDYPCGVQKGRIAHRDGVSGLAVGRKPESHTVTAVQGCPQRKRAAVYGRDVLFGSSCFCSTR